MYRQQQRAHGRERKRKRRFFLCCCIQWSSLFASLVVSHSAISFLIVQNDPTISDLPRISLYSNNLRVKETLPLSWDLSLMEVQIFKLHSSSEGRIRKMSSHYQMSIHTGTSGDISARSGNPCARTQLTAEYRTKETKENEWVSFVLWVSAIIVVIYNDVFPVIQLRASASNCLRRVAHTNKQSSMLRCSKQNKTINIVITVVE